MGRKPKNSISLYLIKSEYEEVDDFIKEGADQYTIRNAGAEIGTFFTAQQHEKIPPWTNLFKDHIPTNGLDNLKTKSAKAVFALKVDGRFFAIAFGHGRFLLKSECVEEQFGLRVALNSVDKDNMKTIDRRDIDTLLTQTRVQASKMLPIEEYGINVVKTLLKSVQGKSKDDTFSSTIGGSEPFQYKSEASLLEIADECRRIIGIYSKDDYKNNFAWIDNIREISKKSQKNRLDKLAVKLIKNKEFEKIFLAFPDIVDWNQVEGYFYNKNKHRATDIIYDDLSLVDFLEDNDIEPTNIQLETLTNKYIFKYLSTGEIHDEWKVYKCINCEIEEDNKIFILTEGRWFEVNKNFVSQVNQSLLDIELSNLDFPKYNRNTLNEYHEKHYIADVADSFSDYIIFDRKNISYGGNHSSIEFCDLMSPEKQLIHIKRYSGSSVLSHLFLQGFVSAKTFLLSTEFRTKVIAKNKECEKYIYGDKKPNPQEFEIIYAIISKKAADLPNSLPFFSKIALQTVYQELVAYGFKVSLLGIPDISDQ